MHPFPKQHADNPKTECNKPTCNKYTGKNSETPNGKTMVMVHFIWVSAYYGIEQNERADQTAKQILENQEPQAITYRHPTINKKIDIYNKAPRCTSFYQKMNFKQLQNKKPNNYKPSQAIRCPPNT